ncbi:hypothetical protein PISMIDRAFT_199201 [Pisolithus microcarpus 441]|uniref:Unplaced genomic scaffold scaffold_13, whole genome shotgun sequence n=1 Tax=Pisolithus microcarpus 441 TaxID=765257 RepID=A0A0D0A505_9AGAM|nr:hypothetical protein PISMIDRAFT_199201 [Pisolithus microcarpus 441]
MRRDNYVPEIGFHHKRVVRPKTCLHDKAPTAATDTLVTGPCLPRGTFHSPCQALNRNDPNARHPLAIPNSRIPDHMKRRCCKTTSQSFRMSIGRPPNVWMVLEYTTQQGSNMQSPWQMISTTTPSQGSVDDKRRVDVPYTEQCPYVGGSPRMATHNISLRTTLISVPDGSSQPTISTVIGSSGCFLSDSLNRRVYTI